MEIISFLIHAYLYLIIFEFLTEKGNQYLKWVFVLLFGFAKYLAEAIIYTQNLVPLILCTLLIFYGAGIRNQKSHFQNLKYALVTYGIDLALSIIIGSTCGFIGGLFEDVGKNWMYISASVGRVILVIILNREKVRLEKFKESWVLYIGAIAATVVLIIEQVLRLAYANNNRSSINVGVVCIYIAALFTTLWLLDHYKMLKIQNEYAIDNRQMSQKLHRSKEVLPLLADYVSSMDSLPDEKMRQKLQEVCHDYGKELGETDMDVALFNTTGVGLLDLLLQNKATECKRINVQMEVFVGTEIDEDMERLNVSDGELIRMMGDLLRNAIKAVQAPGSTDALILAMVARDECGNVEIQVHDSGIPFPKEVLEKLGERGNTTWGTGNGIADVVESLRRVQASLEIISESDPNDIFTKEVCIRFDGKGTVRAIGDQVSA